MIINCTIEQLQFKLFVGERLARLERRSPLKNPSGDLESFARCNHLQHARC
jgi:hypothetical protein